MTSAGDPRVTYVDSSALVKLVITEAASAVLPGYLGRKGQFLRSSQLARVEVTRAVRRAIPDEADLVESEADRVFEQCELIAIDQAVLERARGLAPSSLRTLDAIHVATALEIEAGEFISYDDRQLTAAAAYGLRVASPGTTADGSRRPPTPG